IAMHESTLQPGTIHSKELEPFPARTKPVHNTCTARVPARITTARTNSCAACPERHTRVTVPAPWLVSFSPQTRIFGANRRMDTEAIISLYLYQMLWSTVLCDGRDPRHESAAAGPSERFKT